MKVITVIIVLITFNLCLSAQNDTIFKTTGDKIYCTITLVNDLSIFYNDKKGNNTYIPLNQVQLYSQNGKRNNGILINEKNKALMVQEDKLYMKNCLAKCHKQYINGVITLITGVCVGAVGSALTINNTGGDNTTNKLMIFGGGLTSLVGGIIMIDSHKWIGRAALSITSTGATITFKIG